MKKIFTAEYPDYKLFNQIEDWIKAQTLEEDGSLKIFRPKIVVEIYDQNGDLLTNK